MTDRLAAALERCERTIERHFAAGNLVGLPGIVAIGAVLKDARAALSTPTATDAGEPVAWQWRYCPQGGEAWSDWTDGKAPSFRIGDGYRVEERPLYAHPAPAALTNAATPADPARTEEGEAETFNEDGLLPCPKCESHGAYTYWWQRGQAWIVICPDCKHEADARESHEHEARAIWNREARAARSKES